MDLYILAFLIFLITFILLSCIRHISFFNKNLKTTDEFVVDFKKYYSSTKIIRGAGIVFYITFILSTLIITSYFDIETPNRFLFFLLSLSVITIMSFVDDCKSIDPKFKLILHLICVYVAISSLKLNLVPLPFKVSIFFAVLIWVYLINITNFVDGSDGFCSVNIISFYIGILILSTNHQLYSFYIAIILLPTLLTFLIFNIPNAKLFMGDSGSIFLGFLLGFSFLEVAILINPIYPCVLFIYPLMDCTISLVKKTLKGYLPWARHGDYFFLIPKKKVHFIKRKKVSLMILRIITIFSILNLTFFYLAIKFSNNYLLMLCPFLTIFVIYIYKKSKFTKKYRIQ